MAILVDETKRVLVQGITGREGQARTRLMRDYGTNVVAGVTPGKGGQSVLGVPVFNTPREAVKVLGKIDISVLFVPAGGIKDAAISAIDAGIKLTVLVADRVPVWDAMEIAAAAKANGAIFVGPNTLGVLSPGKAVVGMIGGRAESARNWFKPGIPKGVGVISRSGGMASSTGYYLGQAGVRISTIAHVGGDAVLGIRIPDAASMFEDDPFTEAVVIFGEIGSSQEEELAQLIRDRKVTKPVIAYIGGKAAREGTRFSHAGAIIEGGRGTHAGKVKALREAGATVVDAFGELPAAVVEILKTMKGQALMNEAEKNAVWNTAVTRVEPNRVAVRGYDIAELMGRVSFGAAVHLILTGELPEPRAARLFELAREAGVDGAHMKAAQAVEKSFADAKKPLPINVDGAIGAILAALGMNPAAFNGIFMIARTPGLVAHVIEEQTREKPMRRIDPVNHGYDGPAARSVPE